MRLGLLLFALLFGGQAMAAPAAKVADAPNGTTLRLDDGRLVILDGILPPGPADDDDKLAADRLAAASKAFLLNAAVGRAITFQPLLGDGAAPLEDRWGRIPADVALAADGGGDGDGAWLQGRMLAEGLARVDACPRGDGDRLARLRAAEASARAARRGVWALAAYWPRSPRTQLKTGIFVTVEGAPVAAGGGRRQRYLNFGADWREDFTLAAPGPVLSDLDAAGLGFDGLVGRNLRMRGWLTYWNGPLIRIACPQQIEVLSE